MRFSVIIPVYNAASTLLSSLESIDAQTFGGEIEICAADDCSTDGSGRILENFKERFEKKQGRTMIIRRHEGGNKGVAVARNTGLDMATGDFICFVDADDHLSPDALEVAEKAITASAADIIGWDWTLQSTSGDRYMRQPDCQDPEAALKALMGGTLRWNLWLFAIRTELFDGIRFSPGMNMGEDMMAVMRAMMKAGKFSQIHESLYSYLQTGQSISKTMTEDNLNQVCNNLNTVEKALLESGYAKLADPFLSLLKLNVKLPLIVSLDKNDYIRWFECYPEASSAIMKNHHLPMRTKLFQWMAARRLWIGVRIYNILVYGLFYKALLCKK